MIHSENTIKQLFVEEKNIRNISRKMKLLSSSDWKFVFTNNNIPSFIESHVSKYFKLSKDLFFLSIVAIVFQELKDDECNKTYLNAKSAFLKNKNRINSYSPAPSLKGLSLFANAGIAESLLSNTNLEIVVANELLQERCDFYQKMHPSSKIIQGDITNESVYDNVINTALRAGCNFLMATPPCQGMSIAGKMSEDDPRNLLIKYAVQAIIDIQPEYALIENVVGALKTYILDEGEKIKIIDFIDLKLKPFGYTISAHILNVADYGTPQSRKRSIFLISKHGDWSLPKIEKRITVRESISHLPSLESGENSNIPFHYAKTHNDRHILWMKHTPSGKTAFDNILHFPQKDDGIRISGFSTTYKRMNWDKPAPTITMANGSISSQNNVHPGRLLPNGIFSDARVLTLKEIFILTGLPDNWTPPEWAKEGLIRQVIGEGVPPRLIERLINAI